MWRPVSPSQAGDDDRQVDFKLVANDGSTGREQIQEAEDAFRKTHQLNLANPRGLMGLVETQMAQSRPDQALALMRSEAAKSPNHIDLPLAIREHRGPVRASTTRRCRRSTRF
jgi:hypothetical protein